MSRQKEMPRWASILFLILGAYVVAISLGVLPYGPPFRSGRRAIFDDPQHWQITSFGVAFICAGIVIAFRDTRNWLLNINLIVLVPSLIAPIISIVYFHSNDLIGQVFVSFILFITFIITVASLLPSRMHSKKPPVIALGEDPVEDPLHDAEVHLSWGRTEQAVAILEKAMQRYPSRAAEFQRKLSMIRQDA